MVTMDRLLGASAVTFELTPWRSALPAQVCDAWDMLSARDAAASIFTRREWFEPAMRHRAITDASILLVRKHGHPIALLPLHKRSPWSWELLSWFPQDDAQMLIDPTEVDDAWDGALRWLCERSGKSLLSFGNCRDDGHREGIIAAANRQGLISVISTKTPPTAMSLLPSSWEELLEALTPSTRKDMRQAERTLERDYPDLAVEFLTDPAACRDAFAEFLRLFRQRWGDRPGGCEFDRPGQLAAYQEMLDWAVRNGYGMVTVLRAAGRTLVVQITYHLPGQDTLYAQFIARDTDAIPKRYSPGMVLMNHTIRWAIRRGITRVNLGHGAVQYKLAYNGSAHPRAHLAMARSPLGAAIIPQLDVGCHLLRRAPVHLDYHMRRLLRGLLLKTSAHHSPE